MNIYVCIWNKLNICDVHFFDNTKFDWNRIEKWAQFQVLQVMRPRPKMGFKFQNGNYFSLIILISIFVFIFSSSISSNWVAAGAELPHTTSTVDATKPNNWALKRTSHKIILRIHYKLCRYDSYSYLKSYPIWDILSNIKTTSMPKIKFKYKCS